MPHPLVTQLRFTRSEFARGLDGLSAEEAAKRFAAMNPIAWVVGHLAWHEQAMWLERGQGKTISADVKACRFGAPASDPPLDAMLAAWREITAASEAYLDTLDSAALATHWERDGKKHPESIGTSMRRVTYHYWFHLGETQAIRQMLGHGNLPAFVGNQNDAPYVAEIP